MDVKLVVVAGETPQANEFALQLPTVVGRSKTADLPLANALVSRKHCEIYEEADQLMVRDLGSLNGTFVGKTRIEAPAAVPPGTLLTIGAITFRADYAGANGAAVAAAPAAAAKAAAPADSDEPTINIDELDSLEPLAGSAGEDDAEFSLAWLDEDSGSPVSDSGGANGAVPADAKKTVAKETVAANKKTSAKNAAKAEAKAAKPVADEDNLDDLCQ